MTEEADLKASSTKAALVFFSNLAQLMDYRSESLFCVKISKIQSKAGSSFGILLLFVSLSFPVFFSVC